MLKYETCAKGDNLGTFLTINSHSNKSLILASYDKVDDFRYS